MFCKMVSVDFFKNDNSKKNNKFQKIKFNLKVNHLENDCFLPLLASNHSN